MAKYSIVIPCYNVSQYILTALNSIVIREDIEIIIVDDGSKDELTSKLKQYKGNKLIYQYKDNGGVSSARNEGLKLASGEFIIFFDGDDLLDDELFDYLDDGFKDNSVDLISFGYNHVKPGGVTYYSPGDNGFISGRDLAKNIVLRRSFQCMCSFSVRRKLILDLDLTFDVETYFYEDIEFQLKTLSSCNRVMLIDKPLFKYILRNESSTNSKVTLRHFTLFNAIDRIVPYYNGMENEFLYFKWYSLFWLYRMSLKYGCDESVLFKYNRGWGDKFKLTKDSLKSGVAKTVAVYIFQLLPSTISYYILKMKSFKRK